MGRLGITGVPFAVLKTAVELTPKGCVRCGHLAETYEQFTAGHDLNTLLIIFSNEE